MRDSHYQIELTDRRTVNHLIEAHYLRRWPGVVVAILSLLDDDVPIGCVVFALPPRETNKRYGVNCAWELARLFIADGTPKNTETWFVARALRWVRKNRPDVNLIVSYADPAAGHDGTIYRAGNWIADGMTDQERRTPRFDYADENTGKLYSRRSHVPDETSIVRVPRVSKFRFIYWMNRSHEKLRQKSIDEKSQ